MDDKILEARKALYKDLGEIYRSTGNEIPDFDTFNKLFGENKDFQKAVYDDIDYKSFDVSYEDYERVMGLGVDGTQEEEVKPVTEGKQEEVSLSDSKDSSGQSLEQLESSRPQVVAGENVFLQEGEELISGETEEGAYLAIRQPDGEYSNVLEPVEVTATRNIETAEAEEDTADWVNTTFGSRLKNSIMASVSDFNTGLATTPEFLYGLGSVAFNALADGLDKIQEGLGDSVRIDPEAGYEYLASGRYNPLRLLMEYADSQKDNAEYHNTQLPEDFHSIETSLVNGDFLRAGEQLLTSVVSSAPSLVYLSMTGGAGAGQTVTRTAMQTAQRTLGRTALVTLPFSASEYQRELDNVDSQMNPTLRPVYSLLSGMSEILDAEIGASSIIRGQIANKTTGVRQVAELATGYVEKALAKEGIPKYVFNGAVSEGTIRFTQNVISKYSGSNPDLDLKDGIFDSILVGGALSGSVATKTHVTNRIVKSLSDARLKKNLDRIESLRKEVESATSPEVAEVLQDRMESVVADINAETDAMDIEGRISRLSEEDVNRLTELDEEAIRIENALNDDSNLSQETSTALEERLSEIDRESTEILNKDSQEGLTDSEVETVTEGEIVSETAELNTVTEEIGTSIFQNITDVESRTQRLSELEASLKQQFEDAKKLGIKSDPREKAQEDLKFLRDLTEYAVLKIADGTVNTVQAFHDIAKNIGDFGKEVLDRAYYDAVESAKAYIESNPDVSNMDSAQGEVLTRLQDPNLDRRPSETKVTKKQIRESTESKIKGEKVSMTPKQALANQIRTLNRGARDAVKSVREIQGRLREYIGESTKGKAGMKFTAGEYRGLARLFQGVHNEKTLEKALTLVDKSIDKADFRKKLASINTNQRAVKRKNLPVSQKKVAREFANINPRDFMPFEDGSDNSPLNRYLDMLEDLNKSGIKKSNVSNVMMEQMINFAQQGREILDLEAEVKRNQAEAIPETLTDKEKSRKVGGLKTRLKNLGMSDADITKVITEAGNIDAQIEALNAEVDSRKIDGLKSQLKELGMDDSEIATIVDSGKELSQIIKELTDKVDEIKPSRLDVIKETSHKLVEELNNRVDEIADSMTESDAREFRAFVESINLKNLPDKYFLPLNYVLNNLVNNNSISGILTFRNIFNSVNKLNDTKRVKSIMDNFRKIGELKVLRNLGFKGNINTDDARKFFLSTLYTRIEAIIKDTNFVGATHDFFGFSKYDAGSKIVKDRLNDVKGGVADILAKYNKIDPNYWKDSYNTSIASAYAILAQYKDTWSPERVQAEFNGRLEALVESYDRLREYTQNLKAIPQDAVNQLETLGRIVSELAVVEREADGSIKEVTGKKNLDEIWASLPEGYQEYYNYTRDFFEGIKEEFFTVQRMIGKEDVDTSWKNYFPLSYTDLRETIFGRGKGSSDVDLTEIVGGNMRNTTTPLSSAGKDRVIVGKLLPKGQGLNLDLLTNFELEAGKALSDIYTLPQAYEINLMTDVVNNGMSELGYDVSPVLTYRNIMHDRLSADHEMIQRMGIAPNNSTAKVLGNFLKNMGMVRTLGGWSQFLKQSTIFTEVMGRLKNKSTFFTAVNIISKGKYSEDVKRILDASDLSLRNRQEHLFSIKDDVASLNKELDSKKRNLIQKLGINYNKVFEKTYKTSLKPLIGTDNYMAKLGWLAMYLDHMQTQGYSIQEALASEVNSEALAKANHSNSVVQNASDASMQGNYSSSLFKLYQPMMGFSLNSMHNFTISVAKLKDAVKQGDRRNIQRYGTEMAMNITNAALFVWMSWFTRRVGIEGAEFITKNVTKFLIDDDEERRDLILEEITKEFGHRKLSDEARTWGYMVNDLLTRGIFSDATSPMVSETMDALGFQEFLFGREELEQAGYSPHRFKSSTNENLAFMEQWLPILGVRGMGLLSMATAVDNVKELFDTHEKYIRDTRGVPYADGSGIHVDLGLLDEEGIADFGIPEYLRASQYFAGTAGLISLFGASDQTIGTMVRNVKNVTRKVAEKERGRRRTGDWDKTLMKDVVSFHSVDVGGVKVELTPQEAREAREAYLDLVEYHYDELYRFDDKLSQSMIEEEVAQISRATVEAGIIANKTDELVKGSLDSVEDELKELNAFKRSIKLQVDADKRRIARERREKQKRKRRNDPLGERR